MRFFLPLLLIISTAGQAQWKDFVIGVRGDTLNRVDMQGRKQGPWVVKVPDLRGERGYEEEGYFENDQREGTWKRFSLEGVKIAEENYRWGKLNGRQFYYTYNGGLSREESWRAIDPSSAYDTVPVYDVTDPSKVVNYVVVKNDGVARKHGKWKYYDPREGRVEASENWVMGKLQTDEAGLVDDEEIRPISVSTQKARSDTAGQKAKPQVILDYEKKNSGKNKIKVRDGSTGN